jgi:hypothetical protein
VRDDPAANWACPDAVVVQSDPARVGAAREQVPAALQGVPPAVEPADDAFFLDLRGLSALYAGDMALHDATVRAAVRPPLRPRLRIAAGRLSPASPRGTRRRTGVWWSAPRGRGAARHAPARRARAGTGRASLPVDQEVVERSPFPAATQEATRPTAS